VEFEILSNFIIDATYILIDDVEYTKLNIDSRLISLLFV